MKKVIIFMSIWLAYFVSCAQAQSINTDLRKKVVTQEFIVATMSPLVNVPKFEIAKDIQSKLVAMQWEIKASKTGRPILSGNRYQLVNLFNSRGMKRQKRSKAANLGWLDTSSSTYNMKIQRQAGNGQVRYGDRIALHMTPYGWLKYKKQGYGINLSDDDNNPHYIWLVTGGKKGQKLVSGMPFALFNTTEGREMVYCKRTWGINLGWQGLSCSDRWTSASNYAFGENGLFARDGLTGEGFVKLKDFLCDKGVKAGAAYITAQSAGAGAVALAATPKATEECKKI